MIQKEGESLKPPNTELKATSNSVKRFKLCKTEGKHSTGLKKKHFRLHLKPPITPRMRSEPFESLNIELNPLKSQVMLDKGSEPTEL